MSVMKVFPDDDGKFVHAGGIVMASMCWGSGTGSVGAASHQG